MTEDILLNNAQAQSAPQPVMPVNKKNISVLGVILTIILTIVLILLGERIIFDLNKAANPVAGQSTTQLDYRAYNYAPVSYEKAALGLSSTQVTYPTEKKGEYVTYKMLIHAAFIIPVFLLTFLLYYMFNVKKMYPHYHVVMYGYLVFAFWMLLHLLIDLINFILEEFANSAVYIILGIMVVIFTALAVFIQKKVSAAKA